MIVSRFSRRVMKAVNVDWSLPGMPTPRRIHAVLTCVVRATSVSPSQCPVVKPEEGCHAFGDGCGRPSIQILTVSRR